MKKSDTQYTPAPTMKQTPDEIWMLRRRAEAGPARFVADLRQLADEIEAYAASQQEKRKKIREILDGPTNSLTLK